MNRLVKKTKVSAFILLFFANLISAHAQTDASIYQIPAGTTLSVRMDNEINSKVFGVDDTFTVTLAAPVVRREVVVLPIGTIVEGRITKVRRAAYGGKNGNLEMSFQTLRLANNVKREISGVLISELKAESASTTSVLTVFGGTAIGSIVGAVTSAENGALIGAGIGAGTGAGIAFLRKGKNVSIKADEVFEIKLMKDVILPVQDF